VVAAFDFPVIAKCSFLVNGIAETDRSRVLIDGDTVDVLPPFAGG
jgi:molybdopterin synthase sulfur carrier subunit